LHFRYAEEIVEHRLELLAESELCAFEEGWPLWNIEQRQFEFFWGPEDETEN
jgi:hypothetical protein